MLLAIDVGNTQSSYGVWEDGEWIGVWRRSTSQTDTEDELAAWLYSMFALAGLPWKLKGVVAASVVPAIDAAISLMAERRLGCPVRFIQSESDLGLRVDYDPPHAVGADRLANALGALLQHAPPLVVVDFGTATTFDVVDETATYIGGAILPGIVLAARSLASSTAKLPQIDLRVPPSVIGKTTVESLQSGLVLGSAGAIESLVQRIKQELHGELTVIATGGLAEMFRDLCPSIQHFEPMLTLNGLIEAHRRIGQKL